MASKTMVEDVQKTQRSVFVGNIPYEATEEQLKEIFDQVGPVVSFRIVYDRETGKPKGYGFCEYQDLETARSAMRNLNDHDFNGRNLRVGHAAGETSNAEKAMSQAVTGPAEEPLYGDAVESHKAPEAISRAVASLPPEQMFELMKQMKMCIQNNPNEARNMLLQNPQLAYALLQAQIVMKIVDPQVALAMLHRQSEQIPPLMPTTAEETTKPEQSPAQQTTPVNQSPQLQDVDHRRLPPQTVPPVSSIAGGLSLPQTSIGLINQPASIVTAPQMSIANNNMQQAGGMPGNFGPRPGIPQASLLPNPTNMPAPLKGPPDNPMPLPRGPPGPAGGLLGDRPGGPAGFDNRNMGGPLPGPRGPIPQGNPAGVRGALPNQGPGFRGPAPNPGGPMGGMGMGQVPQGGFGSGGPPPPGGPAAPMGGRADPRDPRSGRMVPGGPAMGGPPRPQAPAMPAVNPGLMGGPRPGIPSPGGPAGGGITSQDQEKAQLIMQVLQLSDEQIAMLPPDQRQSILILKEQIARSTNP